jgi:hypothetical protein
VCVSPVFSSVGACWRSQAGVRCGAGADTVGFKGTDERSQEFISARPSSPTAVQVRHGEADGRLAYTPHPDVDALTANDLPLARLVGEPVAHLELRGGEPTSPGIPRPAF